MSSVLKLDSDVHDYDNDGDLLVPINHEHKENAGCSSDNGTICTYLLLRAYMYHAHTFIEVHPL
jgi:hypothetical protein